VVCESEPITGESWGGEKVIGLGMRFRAVLRCPLSGDGEREE